jgi:hypothetical protein
MTRDAHHLWSAEKDGDSVRVMRSQPESPPEVEDAAKEVAASMWGLLGATLMDTSQFAKTLPMPVVSRMNASVTRIQQDQDRPRVYTWKELKRAFGNEKVVEIRQFIRDGMRIRIASKDLNIPFIMAADIVDAFKDLDRDTIKASLKLVKEGKEKIAVKKFGKAAKELGQFYEEYRDSGMYKLAIDDSARKYFEDYYGPYGKDLVAEIKKRVVADLAKTWMTKSGVDDVAAEYYSEYWAEYGQELVRDIGVTDRRTPASN